MFIKEGKHLYHLKVCESELTMLKITRERDVSTY
uniref:Uncharacterized protein n=1 Tax=Tetranychus urticae TaxID=32264 RepID=T1JYY2_TETUR